MKNHHILAVVILFFFFLLLFFTCQIEMEKTAPEPPKTAPIINNSTPKVFYKYPCKSFGSLTHCPYHRLRGNQIKP